MEEDEIHSYRRDDGGSGEDDGGGRASSGAVDAVNEYMASMEDVSDEIKIEQYPKKLAKVIFSRNLESFGAFFSFLVPPKHTPHVIREVLNHLSLEVARVIGAGSKEYLVSILTFTVELYLPHINLFYSELLKFRIKLADLFFYLDDYANSMNVLQQIVDTFNGSEAILDKVRVYLKIAECAIENRDIPIASNYLSLVEKIADGGVKGQRMSKRQSYSSAGERTFYQVHQLCSARLECLKGDFGYASHLFWNLSLQQGPDAHESRASALLCAVLTSDPVEREGMYETLKVCTNMEGLSTLRKMIQGELLQRNDLENFSENILEMYHVKKETGLSYFDEVVVGYQLGVMAKVGERVSMEGLSQLLSGGVDGGMVAEYVREMIDSKQIVGTFQNGFLVF